MLCWSTYIISLQYACDACLTWVPAHEEPAVLTGVLGAAVTRAPVMLRTKTIRNAPVTSYSCRTVHVLGTLSQNNLYLCLKTKPVEVRVDASIYCMFGLCGTIYENKSQIYVCTSILTVTSSLALKDSVLCRGYNRILATYYANTVLCLAIKIPWYVQKIIYHTVNECLNM